MVVLVAVIAGLRFIKSTVATALLPTTGIATVANLVIPIIAGFKALVLVAQISPEHAIPAAGDHTGTQAPIILASIAIIAAFQCFVEIAITTGGWSTGAGTGVAIVIVAIVTAG